GRRRSARCLGRARVRISRTRAGETAIVRCEDDLPFAALLLQLDVFGALILAGYVGDRRGNRGIAVDLDVCDLDGDLRAAQERLREENQPGEVALLAVLFRVV